MCLGAAIMVALGAGGFAGPGASAQAAATCARTIDASAPTAPTAGHPCWTDVTPYPFGADGNPVDPSSALCHASTAYGPTWQPGDFDPGGVNGNPPCYLRVTSMAFRAANRGLAATALPLHNGSSATDPFGVWLYNGASWFPDPTFPGSSACPGATVLWAGKLDYWLIGSSNRALQTLCRFDGVNLAWEELTLPQATLARLPADPNTGAPVGGVTSGACYAWNDCWFFGTDGIQVHWDGQALSDASGADPATSPWLRGDFTDAVARTDTSGHRFGLAVTKSGSSDPNLPLGRALPVQPDGSPPPQLFGSSGGPFTPLPFSPPVTPRPNDPYNTDLVAVEADPSGDAWVAADPTAREPAQGAPAPLLRLAEDGTPASCTLYDANTFTYTEPRFPRPNGSYQWTSLSVFPDSGSALAGVNYSQDGVSEPLYNLSAPTEPAIVGAGCGQPPSLTRFRIPDPYYSDQATAPLIPADEGGFTAAVAANATNDGWAATSDGQLFFLNGGDTTPQSSVTKPHLYRYTDGQPSTAPLGDDNEPRPSLFTIEPPVFVTAPPTVVSPVTTTTTTQPSRPKTVKLKPAIYAVHSKLRRGRNGKFMLSFEFSIRRPVTIGVQALRQKTVVASSGLRHFTGTRGHLSLMLDRKRWPTKVRFIAPTTPQV